MVPVRSSSSRRADEALDPIGRATAGTCARYKARKVAVLLNSHIIGEVERVCDRSSSAKKAIRRSGTRAELRWPARGGGGLTG